MKKLKENLKKVKKSWGSGTAGNFRQAEGDLEALGAIRTLNVCDQFSTLHSCTRFVFDLE